MEMCRACLSTDTALLKMDLTTINNYNLLTNLNLEISDEKPLYTCNSCFKAVLFCAEFREKCITSNIALMAVSKLENENDNKLQVKKEIKLEYSTDVEEYYDDPLFDYHMKFKNEENSTTKTTRERKPIETNDLERKETLPRVIDGDPLFNCGICSKAFTSSENLVKHLENHKSILCCKLCTENFIDFTHLLSHRIEHLPYEQKRCHICSKRYVSAEYLEYHYMKKHNLRGENGKLLCKQCLVSYENPSKLHSHKLAVHSDIKFICDNCGKGFRIKTALQTHLLKHNNNKNYRCDFCDFSSKFPAGLKKHQLRRHTEGRVDCKNCYNVYSSQESMDKHKCNGPVIIICPICGICIKKSAYRKRHMLTHTDKLQYKCERCPAKYKSKTAFKAHLDKHDGIKPFHCEFCPMRFRFQSALVKHRRIHTGEKPYVCKICSKAFTGNNNLKVHMKVHGINLFVKKDINEAPFYNNVN